MAKQRTEAQMVQARINRVKAIEAKPSTNLSEAEMVQYRVERVKPVAQEALRSNCRILQEIAALERIPSFQ